MPAEITSQELAELMFTVAEDKKAWEPVLLDVRDKTSVADFFVICEGDTDRQIRAIADAMVERARDERVKPLSISGYDDATWILVDFDSVLVHVFLPGERSYYDLESLWSAAARRRTARDQPLEEIGEDEPEAGTSA